MDVAVVVAVYNGEKYIEKQLTSIYQQSRKADEVIICDDGSKDHSVALIEKFISSNDLGKSWKLYCNETNLNYVQNFYHGISLSSADFIFLSDQDDLWEDDKIEKMSAVLFNHPEIDLLSCNFGVIDENDQKIDGFMVETSNQSEQLIKISTGDILRSYRWPGMTMALRRSFFDRTFPSYGGLSVAHDFVFALFAAEEGGFYEYRYLGCYHRRHGNNVAHEEHRVYKLLNLERKISEMKNYNQMLLALLNADLPLTKGNGKIKAKYEFNRERMEHICSRKLISLLKLYRNYDKIRLKSLFCDVWLICFGDYRIFRK